jgi:hypothetical protein
LTSGGFDEIQFSEEVPYWCAVGRKRATSEPIGT